MTTLELVLIGCGGFLGAVVRYFVSRKMNGVRRIPYGTLTVNFAGSLLIGIVFGMDLPKVWSLFLASGFAGALTTFSTLQKETILLWHGTENNKKAALIYMIFTYGGGIMLALTGYLVGSLIQ